jgi:hypothetical protein
MPDRNLPIDGAEGMKLARSVALLLLATGELIDTCSGRWIVTAQLASASQALADRLTAIR